MFHAAIFAPISRIGERVLHIEVPLQYTHYMTGQCEKNAVFAFTNSQPFSGNLPPQSIRICIRVNPGFRFYRYIHTSIYSCKHCHHHSPSNQCLHNDYACLFAHCYSYIIKGHPCAPRGHKHRHISIGTGVSREPILGRRDRVVVAHLHAGHILGTGNHYARHVFLRPASLHTHENEHNAGTGIIGGCTHPAE